jgi:hypothetical protein
MKPGSQKPRQNDPYRETKITHLRQLQHMRELTKKKIETFRSL